jgi:hypothetical protein
LSYKSTYQRNEAFKVELQWISCRPSLISEFIISFSRRSKQFNFSLFQTSIYEPNQSVSLKYYPIIDVECKEKFEEIKNILCDKMNVTVLFQFTNESSFQKIM